MNYMMWSNISLFQKSVWFQHTDITISSIQDVINHLFILAVLLRKKVNLAIVLSVLRLTDSDYPVVIFLFLTCFSFRLLQHHALTQEDMIYSVTFLGKEVAAMLSMRNRDGLPFTSTWAHSWVHRFSFQSCVFLLLFFGFLVFVLCFMTNVNCVSGLSILIASLVFSK
jgi:hypothetical protein